MQLNNDVAACRRFVQGRGTEMHSLLPEPSFSSCSKHHALLLPVAGPNKDGFTQVWILSLILFGMLGEPQHGCECSHRHTQTPRHPDTQRQVSPGQCTVALPCAASGWIRGQGDRLRVPVHLLYPREWISFQCLEGQFRSRQVTAKRGCEGTDYGSERSTRTVNLELHDTSPIS